jgi:aromatic ring-opening dioxygenase catalytic subunit (LigB family)
MARQPTFFIPHGGGPCFFMDDPSNTWRGMADFLRSLPGTLATPPKAILVVSGHWETQGFALTSSAAPKLLYDYYGFPPFTYQLAYPAPGAPGIAEQAGTLLGNAGLMAALDHDRGLDHGVLCP